MWQMRQRKKEWKKKRDVCFETLALIKHTLYYSIDHNIVYVASFLLWVCWIFYRVCFHSVHHLNKANRKRVCHWKCGLVVREKREVLLTANISFRFIAKVYSVTVQQRWCRWILVVIVRFCLKALQKSYRKLKC